jgi:predicted oxidoreductase
LPHTVTPPKSQDEFELHGQVFAELLQIRSCLLAHASFSQEENFKSQIKSLENVMKKYGSLSSTQVIIAWLEVSKLKLN